MSTTAKPRQPKLRQSCDGCFLAKVKCSKQRPICTRCLSVGLDCRYSPSSRAGKKSTSSSDPSSAHHTTRTHPSELTVCLPEARHAHLAMYPAPRAAAPHSASLYRLDTGWPAPQSPIPLSLATGMPMSAEATGMGPGAEMQYNPDSLPWTTTDMSPAHYVADPSSFEHLGHGRSHSFDMTAVSVSDWTTQDGLGYPTADHGHESPAQEGCYFSSPLLEQAQNQQDHQQQHHLGISGHPPPQRPSSSASAPQLHHHHPNHQSHSPHPSHSQHHNVPSPSGSGSSSCTCFTLCLQSLQALHNASSPSCPPLDTVLVLNRKAVDCCAAMLACRRCMRRSGIQTAAMLLGTIIGKITEFYGMVSRAYLVEGSDGGSAEMQAKMEGGGYHGGRWPEVDILARELRKLEEVYARFREVVAGGGRRNGHRRQGGYHTGHDMVPGGGEWNGDAGGGVFVGGQDSSMMMGMGMGMGGGMGYGGGFDETVEEGEDGEGDVVVDERMNVVGQAMIGYLGRNLGDTMEVVTLRRGADGYS